MGEKVKATSCIDGVADMGLSIEMEGRMMMRV